MTLTGAWPFDGAAVTNTFGGGDMPAKCVLENVFASRTACCHAGGNLRNWALVTSTVATSTVAGPAVVGVVAGGRGPVMPPMPVGPGMWALSPKSEERC